MSTKTATIVAITLVAISFLIALALYPTMPDPMPSHWNAAGEINGYMSRFWGMFLMPLISVGMLLLFLAIPRIDPLKANIAQFIDSYNLMMVLFITYMLYVYALTLFAALGYSFNMTTMLLPAMGALFIVLGFLIGKAKRNFFVGIRTPWTLSSDTVWAKTHTLGKWTFVGAGVICIISTIFGETGFWLMMLAIMFAAMVPIVYSYLLWKKENPD
jgi:immunity protein, SdpI family